MWLLLSTAPFNNHSQLSISKIKDPNNYCVLCSSFSVIATPLSMSRSFVGCFCTIYHHDPTQYLQRTQICHQRLRESLHLSFVKVQLCLFFYLLPVIESLKSYPKATEPAALQWVSLALQQQDISLVWPGRSGSGGSGKSENVSQETEHCDG